jgi:hypothetical protein
MLWFVFSCASSISLRLFVRLVILAHIFSFSSLVRTLFSSLQLHFFFGLPPPSLLTDFRPVLAFGFPPVFVSWLFPFIACASGIWLYYVCRWAWGLRNKSSSPSFRSHLVCGFRISDRYVVMFCAGISSDEAVEIPLLWSFAYSAAVASVVSKAAICQL